MFVAPADWVTNLVYALGKVFQIGKAGQWSCLPSDPSAPGVLIANVPLGLLTCMAVLLYFVQYQVVSPCQPPARPQE
jgi:hypothetical protein